MKTDTFAKHSIRQGSLVITGENGTSIAIPLAEASKLLSAVQRATSEPPEQEQRGMQRNSLRRMMKLT